MNSHQRRGRTLNVALAAALLASACGGVASTAIPSPTPSRSATAIQSGVASPSPSATRIPFPTTTLLAATADGSLRRVVNGDVRERIDVCADGTILSLTGSPDRGSAIVLCQRGIDTHALLIQGSTGQAHELDAAPLRRPGPGTVVWSPDGKQFAILVSGTCVTGEPVCRSSVELRTADGKRLTTPLLDQPALENLRWTVLGLSVFSPTGGGTLLWTGSTSWQPYDVDALVVANLPIVLLHHLAASNGRSTNSVVVKIGAQRTTLTPSGVEEEYALGVVGDDILTWRPADLPNGTLLVHNAAGSRGVAGSFNYPVTQIGDDFFAVVSGNVVAFLSRTQAFSSPLTLQVPVIAIVGWR